MFVLSTIKVRREDLTTVQTSDPQNVCAGMPSPAAQPEAQSTTYTRVGGPGLVGVPQPSCGCPDVEFSSVARDFQLCDILLSSRDVLQVNYASCDTLRSL